MLMKALGSNLIDASQTLDAVNTATGDCLLHGAIFYPVFFVHLNQNWTPLTARRPSLNICKHIMMMIKIIVSLEFVSFQSKQYWEHIRNNQLYQRSFYVSIFYRLFEENIIFRIMFLKFSKLIFKWRKRI